MSYGVWLRREHLGGRPAIGIRWKRVEDMIFTDRYVWRGFSAFGWRISIVGWRRAAKATGA
jgi:hypothetical protein